MAKQVSDKPKLNNSSSQKQLDNAADQFDSFKEQLEGLTNDRMNAAPKLEQEQQTKLSSRELAVAPEVHLKPKRSIMAVHPKTGEREKFNEKFRKDWEHDKQEVRFIAENKEDIGGAIEIWTHPYGGVPAEFWEVPVNKPVWGPRHLAEQIKRCTYHRLSMDERKLSGMSDGVGSYTGPIIVENTINRLDAHPVSTRKSIFMGGSGF